MAGKKRTNLGPTLRKNWVQLETASVLPIEDFFPGCVVAMGQLLPGNIDVELVKEAAARGMHTSTIAAMVGVSENALTTHFSKTIAAVRARDTMDLLGLVRDKALGDRKESDFASIRELLDRQDPKPEKKIAITVQPLPPDIFKVSPADLVTAIRLENKQ